MNKSESDIFLSDIQRLAIPKETEAILSQEAGRRIVNWVAILHDRDGIEANLQAGDVAICPIIIQQEWSDSEMAELMQLLAGLSASALLLFAPISEEVRQAGISADLPIFILPPNTSFRDLHRQIVSIILDRQNSISERGTQLYRELSEMSREGSGLQRMSDLLAQVTGKIIVIQDKRLEIQAITRPAGSLAIEDHVLLATITDQDTLPAILRNRKAAAKASRNHWQQLLLPNYNVARLVSPIVSGDRARGYLSIIGPADALDALDTVAVEQGAAACALEMAKAKAVSEAKKEMRGNFLEGVLAGTLPRKEIERLTPRLDHDTTQPHAVMTFKWKDASNTSLRRIETTLNWLLSTNNRPTLVHIYGDDHVCVFQALRSPDEMSAAQRLAKRLRGQLQADYPQSELMAGLAGPVTNLTDWPEAHQNAMQAMEVARRLNLAELVDYNSLGVYRLLSQLDAVTVVHEFCDQVIGPLIDYDHEHRSNLMQTMEQYFEHHGNVSQTAEALFIHRNTLLYRLERIQELTGHDLNNADMRLALQLGLKLWQLRPNT